MNQKKWSLLKRQKGSQRGLLWGFVGIVLFCIVLYFGLFPLLEEGRKMEDEIVMKRRVVQKYDEFLQNRKAIEEGLQRVQKRYEEVQFRLIPGETPQLGAANLQEIVKKLADRNGISIRSFKTLEAKETVPYRKVSIQIDFSPVNNLLSLGQFIYDLEHHEKKLMISEMDLLIFNIRMPNNIQGSLVVSGVMKGTKPKEKGKEGKA